MGAPDLTVEVLSPSTALEDRVDKHREYALAGVPEYWIVDPEAQVVELFVLNGQEYRSSGEFSGKDILPSKMISNLPVHVEQFFESGADWKERQLILFPGVSHIRIPFRNRPRIARTPFRPHTLV